MSEYQVLNVTGRTNRAGQSVECLRCLTAEIALSRNGVNGVNLPCMPEHVMRLKYAAFASVAAHQAGKPHDPASMIERDIKVADHPELAAALETVFALALGIEAAALGATVETVEFDEPPATDGLGL